MADADAAGAYSTLMSRLAERRATIAVIGLGYVGLPLSHALTGTGHRILGYDLDPAKAERLNAGGSYIRHIPDTVVRDMLAKGFEATSDTTRLATADAILICVPTPLSRNREPDLSYVVSTAEIAGPASARRPARRARIDDLSRHYG